MAAAGIAAGVGDGLAREFNLPSLTAINGQSPGNIAAHTAVGAASLLASAATRSAIEGSSFGRNIMAGLPDVIGQVIGRALVGGINQSAAKSSAPESVVDDMPSAINDGQATSAPQGAATKGGTIGISDLWALADKFAENPELMSYALFSGRNPEHVSDFELEAFANLKIDLASARRVHLISPLDTEASRLLKLSQYITPKERDDVDVLFRNIKRMTIASSGDEHTARRAGIVAANAEIGRVLAGRGLDSQILGSIEIDWQFIANEEGALITDAYVPLNNSGAPSGQSGVTVATGFDIGQRGTSRELRDLGMDIDLVQKLSPYLGRKRWDAYNFEKQNPLVLSLDEAETIDALIRGRKAQAVAREFDAASTVKFDSLPWQQQTVVASVKFQYGSLDKTPTCKRQVTSGTWDAALQKKRNFGDSYTSRRNREADLLNSYLSTQVGSS